MSRYFQIEKYSDLYSKEYWTAPPLLTVEKRRASDFAISLWICWSIEMSVCKILLRHKIISKFQTVIQRSISDFLSRHLSLVCNHTQRIIEIHSNVFNHFSSGLTFGWFLQTLLPNTLFNAFLTFLIYGFRITFHRIEVGVSGEAAS